MSNKFIDSIKEVNTAQKEAANQLKIVEAKVKELKPLLINLVQDIKRAWDIQETYLRDEIQKIAKKYKFRFSNEDYAKDNLDEIIWMIGNNFALYNESCEYIALYPIAEFTIRDVTISVKKDELLINFEFHDMDGFEIQIAKSILDFYFSENKSEVERVQFLSDYMRNAIDAVHIPEFQKRCEEYQAAMKVDETKNERIERLRREAQELGLDIVDKKKK